MKIRVIDIRGFSRGDFERFYADMSSERREKADGFKKEDDRKRCILADYLAREMISVETGVSPETVEFSEDDGGKPYTVNTNIFFNVSHSGNLVACAVSEKPVGIDIEQISSKPLKAISRFATDTEKSFVSDDPVKATILWTLKEACLKATGTGVKGGLKSISFDIAEGNVVCSDSLLKCEYTYEYEGYILAVCTIEK